MPRRYGDRRAFELLHARNAPWLLLRLRRRCRDPELAREPLRETFLTVRWARGQLPGARDEPTAGLDPEQRVKFRILLRELVLDAVVLVSTHLVEDVTAACARVSLVEAGRSVFAGLPEELIAAGGDGDSGDSPIGRGCTAVLSPLPGGRLPPPGGAPGKVPQPVDYLPPAGNRGSAPMTRSGRMCRHDEREAGEGQPPRHSQQQRVP